MFGLLALYAPADTFYGPVEIELPIATTGNPFDPNVNDVRVHVTGPKRRTYERLAFYSHGKWKAVLVLPVAGEYRVTIHRNGQEMGSLPKAMKVSRKMTSQFIRREGTWFTEGGHRPFWPIGHDLAWQTPNYISMPDQMKLMAKNGLNWTRIWACSWDNRNPFWTENHPNPKDDLLSEFALDRWDEAVKGAEAANLKFQFVFFYHGAFSSDVNPNWPEHPWNAKKGGFLKDAESFFTDAEAKRRTKMFLRTAVARWGHSPSIMAWELFNEVQFVDMVRKANRWDLVGEWHDEMGRYIKSIDPYHHLVTTSSELGQPIWKEMDYMQGHGYPPSVAGMLMGTPPDPSKPLFYGEVGPGAPSPEANRNAIREGLWGAFFAGHSGAGAYWYWDEMMKPGMYAEFKTGADLLKRLNSREFERVTLKADVPVGGTLKFVPGRGWDKTDRMAFNLPADAGPDKSGLVSGFLQGTSNRKMQPDPLRFRFKATEAGSFKMRIGQVSRNGADVRVRLNGKEVVQKSWPADANDRRITEELSVDFPVGDVMIEIENVGPDWALVGAYEFDKIALRATIVAAQSPKQLVLWARGEKNTTILVEPPAGGKFREMVVTDLDTDRRATSAPSIDKGRIRIDMKGTDNIIVLSR